ncbi:dolichyl-phosphate-mannose--protein mannosyltransferase [Arsenicicoccus dermatophilus]|uniref:dolichyl-phosphate-mannose--protein mannosyltransferase n=1 Tax=Arsenicicoccus dermatophilus TaxID=1076331 RepID=UPI0038916496
MCDVTPATDLRQRLRQRLLGRPLTDTLRAWLLIGVIAVLGGALRMWRVGEPHELIFDETYYVKDGVGLLKGGVELTPKSSITSHDVPFTHGTTDVFGTAGNFVVHPAVGKWCIAVGEMIFGPTSGFGWRFTVAFMGGLSILMIGLVARRIFRSTLLGVVAALLLAVEGHHFVHSRTSLLDLILMFWCFAAFCALVTDREVSRTRLADRAAAIVEGGGDVARGRISLGIRPWRLLAAVFLGLAIGTKWSGGFYLAVFGLMTVAWDVQARRAIGERHWLANAAHDGVQAALTILPLTFLTYLAGWTGWLRSSNGYGRHWAEKHPAQAGWGWVPDSLRSLLHYHQDMYTSARGITSSHPYMSNPWSWLLQGRPTSFYWQNPKRGEEGCTVDSCAKAITSVGTPTIWWVGTVALVLLVGIWLLRRDWRAGAIVASLAAGYLPWFMYQERTIFSFYAIVFVPYLVLAVTYVLGMVIGGPQASPGRRRAGLTVTGTYLALTVACFVFFWPLYTAQVIPYAQWQLHMWFPSWI